MDAKKETKPQEITDRRELREGEVFCGICGYPVKIETKIGEDGKVTEVLLPHYGQH